MLYPNQLPGARLGEQTILVLRHHWYAFARIIVGFLIVGGLLFAAGWFFLRVSPHYLDHPVIGPLGILAAHGLILLLWIFFANAFIEAYLDVWIVTSSRIIDIEQHGLFHRTISELHLDRIQDVTTSSRGIAATTFNFGTIVVTTAGASERFEFPDMPNPEGVKGLIFKRAQKQQQHALTGNS